MSREDDVNVLAEAAEAIQRTAIHFHPENRQEEEMRAELIEIKTRLFKLVEQLQKQLQKRKENE
jgi:hypothetical protein